MTSGALRGLLTLSLALWVSGCAQISKPKETPLFWKADSIAASSAKSVNLGLKTDQQTPYRVEPPRIKKMLKTYEKVLKVAQVPNAELLLTTGDQANAFAFYSGTQPMVAVNTALLDLLQDDQDELAAVLGHELAHLKEAHGSLRQKRAENLNAASYIGSFLLGAAGVPGGGYLSSFAANALDSAYSRDEERDADRMGLEYAVKAGYSPWGAVRLQEKLEKISTTSWLPLMNSHPPSKERSQAMREMAQKHQERRSP